MHSGDLYATTCDRYSDTSVKRRRRAPSSSNGSNATRRSAATTSSRRSLRARFWRLRKAASSPFCTCLGWRFGSGLGQVWGGSLGKVWVRFGVACDLFGVARLLDHLRPVALYVQRATTTATSLLLWHRRRLLGRCCRARRRRRRWWRRRRRYSLGRCERRRCERRRRHGRRCHRRRREGGGWRLRRRCRGRRWRRRVGRRPRLKRCWRRIRHHASAECLSEHLGERAHDHLAWHRTGRAWRAHLGSPAALGWRLRIACAAFGIVGVEQLEVQRELLAVLVAHELEVGVTCERDEVIRALRVRTQQPRSLLSHLKLGLGEIEDLLEARAARH